METFKPVIDDTVGTNVTAVVPPVPDFSENAIIFAKSLSRLLEGIKEDKVEMPTGDVTPVETALPPTFEESTVTPPPSGPEPVAKAGNRVLTVTDTSLPTEVKAFLDTISRYEARDYDVIVGEGKYGAPPKFSDFSKHPNVIGMRTSAGPSTAAGRYQFVYSTWRDLQKKYPGQFTDFSPATQDRAAWRYAQDIFKEETGADLFETLRSGNIKKVQKALRKIWIGFGLDKDVIGTYTKAIGRYANATNR